MREPACNRWEPQPLSALTDVSQVDALARQVFGPLRCSYRLPSIGRRSTNMAEQTSLGGMVMAVVVRSKGNVVV